MTDHEKIQTFKSELDLIKDQKLKSFAVNAIMSCPDYFFSVPASSSGRYHPSYALGPGGLIRHTKAAVRIAHTLLELEMYNTFTKEQKDMMIIALILHDSFKHGKDHNYCTVVEHPVTAANNVKNVNDECKRLTHAQQQFISGCIASHMGEWNTSRNNNQEVLPKPQTPSEKFIHMCDYLASRKFIEIDTNK